MLMLYYFPVGTFSSVYKAVDLEHDEYSNSHWDYGMDEQPPPVSPPEKEQAEEKKNGSESGKVVAIKRIYVTSSPKRIENEIRILHELRYPHTCSVPNVHNQLTTEALTHLIQLQRPQECCTLGHCLSIQGPSDRSAAIF